MIGKTVEQRFWKYVDVKSIDECWPWTASVAVRGGYGQLMDCRNGKRVLLKSHRVSFEIHNGPVPKDKFVCHKCNNPICCNPNHLYAGTPKDNWNDTIAKHGLLLPKNAPKGETHPDAKLNIEQVKRIRFGNERGADLAKELGVSKATISRIRKGKTWKNVS